MLIVKRLDIRVSTKLNLSSHVRLNARQTPNTAFELASPVPCIDEKSHNSDRIRNHRHRKLETFGKPATFELKPCAVPKAVM